MLVRTFWISLSGVFFLLFLGCYYLMWQYQIWELFIEGHHMMMESEYRLSEEKSEQIMWWLFYIRIGIAAIAAILLPALTFGKIAEWSWEKARFA